jgi:hypothetical protein
MASGAHDTLLRIKRAVISGFYRFTAKARGEMEESSITALDVVEAILNAAAISKVLRSRSPLAPAAGEKLYIIHSVNYEGLPIYTKGKLLRQMGTDTFYIFISAKRAE